MYIFNMKLIRKIKKLTYKFRYVYWHQLKIIDP